MKAEQSSKKPRGFGDIGWNNAASGPWKLKQESKNAVMAKRPVGCNYISEKVFCNTAELPNREIIHGSGIITVCFNLWETVKED
jgi:hypothetical protein